MHKKTSGAGRTHDQKHEEQGVKVPTGEQAQPQTVASDDLPIAPDGTLQQGTRRFGAGHTAGKAGGKAG